MCAGGMLTPCKPCNGAYSMACRRGILHMVAAAHHPCVARAMQEDSSSLGPARLLVHFGNSSIDALSLVPVVLRPFVTRLLLQSSSLQLLTFDNDEVLQEVTKYIQADPSEHVEDEPSLRKVLSGQDGAVHGMCLCPKCWRGA